MIAELTRESEMLRLIRAEYLEMPCLNLTKAQIQRLWGLDQATCDGLLENLVAAQFLRQTDRKGYVLASTAR